MGFSTQTSATDPSGSPEAVAPVFSWYGKLPSAGDFISRRMPYALQQFWDRWCAGGMEVLKAKNPVSGPDFWGGAPTWAFLIPMQPGVPMGQVGVLGPSFDRVGRNFPFVVSAPITGDNAALLLARAASLGLAWYDVIAQAQIARQGIDVVDGRLEAELARVMGAEVATEDSDATLPQGMNPVTLPWPDLAKSFDLQGPESYWWSVPPTTTGFRALSHVGPLNSQHFASLLG